MASVAQWVAVVERRWVAVVERGVGSCAEERWVEGRWVEGRWVDGRWVAVGDGGKYI